MIAEQLQAARAVHWRQKQNPILTLEDAQSWIEQHPLCLFLPRKAQLPAPAPSFVEAVLGESNPTPPRAAIESARELLIRLIGSGHAVGLNLFGGLGEQPDFVAQTEILPFAVSFRGERDWKQPPGAGGSQKVSPLVLDLWKILEKEGPLTAAELREKLGRELTEAAVMRALSELWQTLRVLPALQAEGQPALWALTQHHHRTALTKGSSTSQVTAISLLVSMYLQSVYAATNEEMEIFLSPLVSRSRIREAVRGLAATRQIQSLSMDAQTYYFLEGGLPEFAAEPQPERAEPVRRRRPDISGAPAGLKSPAAAAAIPRWQNKEGAPGRARPSFGARPGAGARDAAVSGRSFDRSSKRPAAARPGGPPAGDWKRRSAAPGAGSGPPAKWRKFSQPGENAPEQRRGTGDRPASRYPSNRPNRPERQDRPARAQGRPQERREGGSPGKKPRWDRNRASGAPFAPRRTDAPRANARGERSPGGAPRRDVASRPPYRRNDHDDRGSKPGQGFSAPKRRSSPPDTRLQDEGRPATQRFSKPAPRGFPKSEPRAGGPGKPSPRSGTRPGSGGGSGGYKTAGYRPGGAKKDGAKREGRGLGGFRPRGFDAKARPGRPKSAKFPSGPKNSSRDKNLEKKKPEA